MKDSIKLSLKFLCMVDLVFCITYLKNNKFNLVTYLTETKIFLCTQLTVVQIVNNTIHAGSPCLEYFGSSTITKTFLLNVLW